MRGWVILVSGMVFCAMTSFMGDTSLMIGAVTQSWVPYVAVPFAMGFVAVGATPVRAGLLGALSSVMLIIAFYAVSPFDTGGYSVDTTSIYYEYGPIGVITGFTLAVLSRLIAREAVEAPAWWALACCSTLTFALIASWWLLGWGTHVTATSSGVTVGASTTDVIASSAIILAFSYAVIVFAIYGLPKVTDQRVAPSGLTPDDPDFQVQKS